MMVMINLNVDGSMELIAYPSFSENESDRSYKHPHKARLP
jgi:hypothetical protein